MKRTFVLSMALTALAVGNARADVQTNYDDALDNPLQTPWSRPKATYLIQDPGIPVLTGDAVHLSPNFSNVIYLNNCKPNGCQVSPGNNDATATPILSSIPDYPSTVQPFAYSDTVWQNVVQCIKASYAPFGVVVTDQRPTSGNYHMAIVAGGPGDVQMQQGVGGVSPFSCGYIPNAVSYSFANIYGGNVDDICWTVAQETAHSWGLDHKYDNRDPMTYLDSGPSRKIFQNAAGPCGEYNARSCQCGGSTMNSFDAIFKTFGGSVPTPPVVKFNEPLEGATVQTMFAIKVGATDDIGVLKGELRIDGQLIATSTTLTQNQFVWNAPATIGQGKHKISVTAYDVANTPATTEINVTLGSACAQADDCVKDGETCVDGRCVLGDGVQGGLGWACATNTDCWSGQCASDAEGEMHCVEHCSIAADACPTGFDCIDTGQGDNGVCWPGSGDGGGCSTGGNDAAPGFLLVLGLGMALVIRRRRR
jgi:MYXO-CTERM domain-containing protein